MEHFLKLVRSFTLFTNLDVAPRIHLNDLIDPMYEVIVFTYLNMKKQIILIRIASTHMKEQTQAKIHQKYKLRQTSSV